MNSSNNKSHNNWLQRRRLQRNKDLRNREIQREKQLKSKLGLQNNESMTVEGQDSNGSRSTLASGYSDIPTQNDKDVESSNSGAIDKFSKATGKGVYRPVKLRPLRSSSPTSFRPSYQQVEPKNHLTHRPSNRMSNTSPVDRVSQSGQRFETCFNGEANPNNNLESHKYSTGKYGADKYSTDFKYISDVKVVSNGTQYYEEAVNPELTSVEQSHEQPVAPKVANNLKNDADDSFNIRKKKLEIHSEVRPDILLGSVASVVFFILVVVANFVLSDIESSKIAFNYSVIVAGLIFALAELVIIFRTIYLTSYYEICGLVSQPSITQKLSSFGSNFISINGCLILSLLLCAIAEAVGLFSGVGSTSSLYSSLLIVTCIVPFIRVILTFVKFKIPSSLGFTLGYICSDVSVHAKGDSDSLQAAGAEKQTNLIPTQRTTLKPIYKLEKGDLFTVSAGDYVPLDSIIRSGSAEVAEGSFSGKRVPKFKDRDHLVNAGAKVLEGHLECEVVENIWRSKIYRFATVFDQKISESLAETSGENTIMFRTFQLLSLAAFFCGLATILKGGLIADGLFLSGVIFLLIFLPISLQILPIMRGITMNRWFSRGVLVSEPKYIGALPTCKGIVVDIAESVPRTTWKIKTFEIVDERYDRDTLSSVLVSMVRLSKETLHQILYQYLRPTIRHPLLYKVTKLKEFEDGCISGFVEGSLFLYGDEAFLIRNGVYVQSSELFPKFPKEFKPFYFAVGGEIVLRVVFEGRATVDGLLPKELSEFGINTLLTSTSSEAQVNLWAQNSGSSNLRVKANTSVVASKGVIESSKPCLLLSKTITRKQNPFSLEEGVVTAVFYDPPEDGVDLKDSKQQDQELLSDITFLEDGDSESVYDFYRILNSLEKSKQFALVLSVFLSSLFFLGVVFSYFGVATVAISTLVFTSSLFFLANLFAKKSRIW